MSIDLSKAIMKRSRLKAKYIRTRCQSDKLSFKKQRNLCVKMKKDAIAKDFAKSTSGLKQNSKPFYAKIKPYMTNKGALSNDDIILFEKGKYVSSDNDIAEIFNNYYTNIVKETLGRPPVNIADTLGFTTDQDEKWTQLSILIQIILALRKLTKFIPKTIILVFAQ